MQPTPLTLAMSTAWAMRRHKSIGPLLDAIRNLGFQRVELNSLSLSMVTELDEALAQRDMSVQSIHNPCPWPVDGAGKRVDWSLVDALSSPDENLRLQALLWAKETVQLAQRVGAQAVIVHLGQVQVSLPQHQLFALLGEGRQVEATDLLQMALIERGQHAGPYLAKALASIRELGIYAAAAEVALGVETRDGYNEIPSLAEFDDVFAATEGLPVFYWHDTGHAEKQRYLGLATPEQYLRRFGDRLLGVHLHDARLLHDHREPGWGEVDFASLASLLPEGALRTLELNPEPTVEEVQEGIAVLGSVGLV